MFFSRKKMKPMKIVIVTNRFSIVVDSLYSDDLIQIAGIIHCYYSKPDEKLVSFVSEHNISFLLCEKIDAEVAHYLYSCQADMGVVFALHVILPQYVFSIPRCGFLNLHPSLLPAYRGPNPFFWQCYDGVAESGFTVHQIDEKEDHGNILGQVCFPIDYNMEHSKFINKMLGKFGVPLLCSSIHNYEKISSIKQTELSPTRRAKNLTVREMAEISSLRKGEVYWRLKKTYPMFFS